MNCDNISWRELIELDNDTIIRLGEEIVSSDIDQLRMVREAIRKRHDSWISETMYRYQVSWQDAKDALEEYGPRFSDALMMIDFAIHCAKSCQLGNEYE